jgi:hypothetical protein
MCHILRGKGLREGYVVYNVHIEGLFNFQNLMGFKLTLIDICNNFLLYAKFSKMFHFLSICVQICKKYYYDQKYFSRKFPYRI